MRASFFIIKNFDFLTFFIEKGVDFSIQEWYYNINKDISTLYSRVLINKRGKENARREKEKDSPTNN